MLQDETSRLRPFSPEVRRRGAYQCFQENRAAKKTVSVLPNRSKKQPSYPPAGFRKVSEIQINQALSWYRLETARPVGGDLNLRLEQLARNDGRR